MKTIYVACPYTGTMKEQQKRFEQVTQYSASLMQKGYRVFSPITHSHPIYNTMPEEFISSIEDPHNFWLNQDLHFMHGCDMVHILCLDGWEDSKGIQAEVNYAKAIGIQVVKIRWWKQNSIIANKHIDLCSGCEYYKKNRCCMPSFMVCNRIDK